MNAFGLIILYLITVNIISLTIMGIDKKRAQKHAWRIPESTLFTLAVIGGSIGSLIGMYSFHHKTRKWYFVYGMPAILVLQLLLVLLLVLSPIEFLVM